MLFPLACLLLLLITYRSYNFLCATNWLTFRKVRIVVKVLFVAWVVTILLYIQLLIPSDPMQAI
ncbi:hypothetical protein Ciccas_000239 [Cichlidogyrus casuarinus]|uniref:Uncharacterized protein n=1 Tax=Cichlidogyrus casuarinus TaxID=1844966 RepID=A0ABD2QNI3_9PLAT